MTTMGVYIRDLLLGQYYFDTLFPRIPVPVMRSIVSNLEGMKLPTKHCGVTGETTRGSEETARRPPSVKASLSVSFGQRAPHRSSTRGSSPVRRNAHDREERSPSRHRSQSRDLSDQDRDRGERERDRERRRDSERDRDRDRRYGNERRSREASRRDYEDRYRRERSSRRSRSRSRSVEGRSGNDRGYYYSSPSRGGAKDKASPSSNLAKLREMYGDLGGNQREDGASKDKGLNRGSGSEEVMKLGTSTWR